MYVEMYICTGTLIFHTNAYMCMYAYKYADINISVYIQMYLCDMCLCTYIQTCP